ncbi:glutathione peroxidase [Staphylospora marina]|uniref:glutathione peroxidase n=1 Tax=Staphylospora marina TaxID=2490858 RepID=UPI000F5B8AEA|nr:glutathione peroxidase [Staphylospora marina]
MSVYQFVATRINGQEQPLSDYKGQVLLIVNTASKCGLTPQYQELQQLYDRYKDRGFQVLGFPCNQFGGQEPGSEEEIQEFCQINYGVTFPMFAKIHVNGPNTHPLFQYLKDNTSAMLFKDIKWNFTKFLVNRRGEVVKRYAPTTSPASIAADIERLLEEPMESA